jgi:DNA-binding transcriptional regulator PaaX
LLHFCFPKIFTNPATSRGYNDAMASQNAPANAKRLLKALIDRGNPVAPEGRVSQVAADTGLNEDEIRPAIKYAKAQGWLEVAKFGHTRGWLSITPGGKAAVES